MLTSFGLAAWLQLSPTKFTLIAVHLRIVRLLVIYLSILGVLRLFRTYFDRYKIQAHHTGKKTLMREFLLSISSFFCFIPCYIAFILLAQNGYYQLYTPWNQNGGIYFVFTIFALLAAHETYHYWYHRFMHTNKWFFKNVHKVHHHSHSPTILSAYAFHPLEAFLHPVIFIIVPLVLPVSIMAIFVAMTIAELFNVLGHIGYEWYPKSFAAVPVLKNLNRATFHDMHHERGGRKNYGYYTLFWDRWMGTHYEDCEVYFDTVLTKRKKAYQ